MPAKQVNQRGNTANNVQNGTRQQNTKPKQQQNANGNVNNRQQNNTNGTQFRDQRVKRNNNIQQPQRQQPQQRQRNNRNNQQLQPPKPLHNYVLQGKERYTIGPEEDARQHQGWRKIGKNGSLLQCSFIPRLANRIDQVYYRENIKSSRGEKYRDTFGMCVVFQDSRLPRNAIKKNSQLTQDERIKYVQQIDQAWAAIRKRTIDLLDDKDVDAGGLVITVDPSN